MIISFLLVHLELWVLLDLWSYTWHHIYFEYSFYLCIYVYISLFLINHLHLTPYTNSSFLFPVNLLNTNIYSPISLFPNIPLSPSQQILERQSSQNEYSSLSIKEALKLILQRFESGIRSIRNTKKIFEGINHIFKVFLIKKGQQVGHRDSLKSNLDKLHTIASELNKEDKHIMRSLFTVIESLN